MYIITALPGVPTSAADTAIGPMAYAINASGDVAGSADMIFRGYECWHRVEEQCCKSPYAVFVVVGPMGQALPSLAWSPIYEPLRGTGSELPREARQPRLSLWTNPARRLTSRAPASYWAVSVSLEDLVTGAVSQSPPYDCENYRLREFGHSPQDLLGKVAR
jgi:hypothetical protein